MLTRDPGDVSALLTRGQVRGDLGKDLQGSENDLDLVIRLSPELPGGYRARGLTRARAEKWPGAIEDYRRYLELVPNAPDAESIHNDISAALLYLGKVKEAEAEFKFIPVVSRPSPLSNRGNLALKKGDVEAAVADFDAAIRKDQGYIRAWALRGQARLRQGRFEEAAKDLDKALAVDPPGFYETILLSGLAHFHRKDVPAARAKLMDVALNRPQHVRGRMAQGILRMLDREYGKAIADLSPAVNDEVLRPFALNLRARAWLAFGGNGLKEAIADTESFVKTLPRDGFAHFEAARILSATARQMDLPAKEKLRDRALELVELACKYQPDLSKKLAKDEELSDLRDEPRFKRLIPK
jgi:tetratricopeptide (TPR) repeat protein